MDEQPAQGCPASKRVCTSDYMRWKDALCMLNAIEFGKLDPFKTPLGNCDVLGDALKHKFFIDRVTTNTTQASGQIAKDYILSHRVLDTYFEQLRQSPCNFFDVWRNFLQTALSHAKPQNVQQNATSFVPILDWQHIDTLLPMIEFLVVMSKPMSCKFYSSCDGRVCPGFSSTAETISFVRHRGQESVHLIFSYMDHVWGFSHRAPRRDLFVHESVQEVIDEMQELKCAWQMVCAD